MKHCFGLVNTFLFSNIFLRANKNIVAKMMKQTAEIPLANKLSLVKIVCIVMKKRIYR